MLNFNLNEALIAFLLLLLSGFFGALLMYLLSRHIFKIIIDESLNYNKIEANEMLSEFINTTQNIENDISKLQMSTLKKFESITQEMQVLSKVLAQFRSHLLKVETLESEIIKCKKIIKRMEKK